MTAGRQTVERQELREIIGHFLIISEQIKDYGILTKEKPKKGGVALSLTVEAINSFLSHSSSDPSVNPLVLVALILQEVLKQVQHLRHLQQNTGEIVG